MMEKDEEILWQSKINLKFNFIILLIWLVVLVIGIIIDGFILNIVRTPNISIEIFLLVILILIILLITGVPLMGILYPIVIWSFIKIEPRSYFATNNKIAEKRENKEYDEYYTFEYSKIDRIEIKPVLFLKDKVAIIRIFPDFNSNGDFEWRFQFFKEQGVKLPQRLLGNYFSLYNVSDYEPLLKILEQNHVKIINK